jgi:hypothetical protein
MIILTVLITTLFKILKSLYYIFFLWLITTEFR